MAAETGKDNDIREYADLTPIMKPSGVAIIGASRNPDKVGHVIMQNYIDVGYSGRLYPVNLNDEGNIMGFKAYSSISAIKRPVDLAVIAIPAKGVPKALEECGKAKVKGAIVVSGGFAEIGERQLQEELVEISRKYRMPVMGPNCLGVMDMRSRVDTLFLPTFKIDKPGIGGVSFASQSGAVGSSVLDMIAQEGFGIASFISYGNAAVVDEVDILDYLMRDKHTKVIVFYMEGVKRGKEFIEVARKVTKIKPVVIMKGGITEEGAKAASSHTASMAGSHEAYEAVFRQFGFTEAEGIGDMLNFAKILDTQPGTTGKRIAIITNGGGTGVLATDALYKNGLEIARLSKGSEAVLKKAMPPIVNVRMPLDMAGDADDVRFDKAISTISSDPNVDALMVIALFQTPGADSRVAAKLISYNAAAAKPMVVVSPGGSYTEVHKKMMESSGVPVYESPEDAARSLRALIDYYTYRGYNGKKNR
ncbi:MAG: acetate--CoA ligase family protein [Candidatus Marsarchaeota archaeon]|jgi:acetyl coenzyme A synthetase (ADP forming)-like protein|nr:acetate--CoA ligase family protein [Candidatus Marsarchaeota archaeon]